MTSENNLAENLRRYRIAAGLKQRQVAEKLNVSVQTVSKWECGTILPDLPNLCRLTKLLRVSADALLQGRGENKPAAFLGVDGGGTKTDFALCDGEGNILRSVTREGCNPTVCGMEKTLAILEEGIGALGAADFDLKGAFFGIAGCPDEARRGALTEAFARRFPGVPAEADADIVNVIYAGGCRGDCIAAICGTGSVAFACKNGKISRIGGWGPLFDNAGSGFDIGRDALRAALAQEDGFGRRTLLTGMLREKLGKCLFDAAASIPPDDFAFVASLSPLVFAAEKKGDAAASEILHRNFSRLAYLINTASRMYDCCPDVIVAGGVAANEAAASRYLEAYLDDDLKLTICREAPIIGALRKAREVGAGDMRPKAGSVTG